MEVALELERRLRDRTARIGVIGLGYVGLPLTKAFHQARFSVIGFDVDPVKVESLERGEAYINSVDSDTIQAMRESGRFEATCNFARIGDVDAVVICVPTPLTRTREPDLSHVRNTVREVRQQLQRGQLVVLESTTYPGTTAEIVVPLLEESGLSAGRDFYVAYSPEREDPGNRAFSTRTIPKVVGGIDETSGRLASLLYRAAVDEVVDVSHANVAEATKILENIYRAVNIALVNELKILFDRMGINVWEVISAASTKPFGFQAFYPGPGLGGHCIPIDPFYLTWKAREYDLPTRFIELAGEINTSMPAFVVHKVAEALNRFRKPLNGSRGLVIGVAYKANTDDVRESPAFKIMELLERDGACLSYHDPFVPKLPAMRGYQVEALPESVPLDSDSLAEHDFAVIVTNHDGIDWNLVVRHSHLVVDTRNATRDVQEGRDRIFLA